MQGDLMDVRRGESKDLMGYVESIEADGWLWVKCRFNETFILVHEDEVRITQPENILSFSKEKGYNVSVGDTLQVVRGVHYGVIGVVKSFNFPGAEVELLSEFNGGLVSIFVIASKSRL